MQEVAEDVFPMAASEGWADPVARKALQFIERRQRNRAAIEKSPFDSLEQAVATAARDGLSREIASEIAYLSGIKPLTGAKILGDAGGEPLAILCKATGLSKTDVHNLWRSMRRPEVQPDGSVHPDWERVQITYDLLAVDRAQTVLRYWNWSLSSALTPALLQLFAPGMMNRWMNIQPRNERRCWPWPKTSAADPCQLSAKLFRRKSAFPSAIAFADQ